jgi:hypothetical protein
MQTLERDVLRNLGSKGLLRAGVLATTMLSLGGCGGALQWWESRNNFMVAAGPLCESLPDQVWGGDNTCVSKSTVVKQGTSDGQSVAASPASGSPPANSDGLTNKEYLARVVNESEYKCSAFLNGLVLTSNTTSTVLDGMTTVFGALGTVFTPLGTVHALTAGGSISSGFNGVIRSDVYAQQAVANYAQAIQSSYYNAIQQYLTDLVAVPDDASIVRSAEVARIRIIHKSCTLASAQATISATLRSEASSTVGQTVTTVTVTADAKAKDVYTLTGTGGLKATYAAGVASAATVAAGLVSQIIDPAQKFVAAGVTVARAPAEASFTLSAPSTIKWTTTGALSATSAASTSTTESPPSAPSAPADAGAGSAPASNGTRTSTTTSVTNHVRNPGAALR